MLQHLFVDGVFDPVLQQFLRLQARTDDFATTISNARQYMNAQEQAKISAMSKKPNVCFAASDEPPPTVQMQPILDGLQKYLEAVVELKPGVKAAEAPESGGSKKGKGGNRQLTTAPSEASINTSAQATGPQNPPKEGMLYLRPGQLPFGLTPGEFSSTRLASEPGLSCVRTMRLPFRQSSRRFICTSATGSYTQRPQPRQQQGRFVP